MRLTPRARTPAASLSHGDQRKLEVAILLALEPDVFMFDEPTAGMSVDEVPVVLDLIEAIKAEGDKTILLVEHKMDVVRRLADRVIVLHQGALVADGAPDAVVALADRAGGVSRHAAERRRMAEPILRLSGVHTHIGHYHILHGVDLVVAPRTADHAARPQRRGQDDDAAHDHGPVARERRYGGVRRAPISRPLPRPTSPAAALPTCRRRWAFSPS